MRLVLRRIGALLYDALLLIAIFVLAAIPFVLLTGRPQGWMRLLFQFYLLAVAFVFLGWFWVHGGQTLGLRAWRLRVTHADGGPLGWRTAALRFLAALLSWGCAGLGFLWMLFDNAHLTWHDRLSHTRVVLIPKALKGSRRAPQQV